MDTNPTTTDADFDEASIIQGFDIELSEKNAQRIDGLVDDYEKSILSRVDEEYSVNSSFSGRLADNIAKLGGSWTFIGYFGGFLAVWMSRSSISPLTIKPNKKSRICSSICTASK